MTEVLKGNGTLRQVGQPSTEWQVRYHFVITTNLVTRPGFPPAVGRSHSQGTVTAINGDSLPAGYFELTAEDGEILRVQSHGFGPWMILSPIA